MEPGQAEKGREARERGRGFPFLVGGVGKGEKRGMGEDGMDR